MRDFIELDTTPCDEPCFQIGSDDYYKQTRIEAKVFIEQLIRIFGEGTENNYFSIKSNPHDFGTYHSLAVYYNDNDEESVDYAYNIEGNTPEKWDEEAIKELKELGYDFKGGK